MHLSSLSVLSAHYASTSVKDSVLPSSWMGGDQPAIKWAFCCDRQEAGYFDARDLPLSFLLPKRIMMDQTMIAGDKTWHYR